MRVDERGLVREGRMIGERKIGLMQVGERRMVREGLQKRVGERALVRRGWSGRMKQGL